MRIDLHAHSTASDGTQSPAELVELAVQAGLDVLALTDHDSGAGWAEAAEAARSQSLTLVRGMEISTQLNGAGLHLLAYLPDTTYPPLVEELAIILAGRQGRLAAILEQLRANGVELSEGDVRLQVGSSPAIGRPHIADALVANGVVGSRDEAFHRWLSAGQPGHVVRYATDTEAMIRLVTGAGGVAVIAHPWGRGSRRVLNRESLAELSAVGLIGIEVDHQDHSAADREHLRRMATELDLVMTGSSDFHGDGKVDHELGCNLTDPRQLRRLLEAAAASAAASGRDVPEVIAT